MSGFALGTRAANRAPGVEALALISAR